EDFEWLQPPYVYHWFCLRHVRSNFATRIQGAWIGIEEGSMVCWEYTPELMRIEGGSTWTPYALGLLSIWNARDSHHLILNLIVTPILLFAGPINNQTFLATVSVLVAVALSLSLGLLRMTESSSHPGPPHWHLLDGGIGGVVQALLRAGFYGPYRMGAMNLDHALITAFVERWRQETHTFHLPIGEACVTLEGVAVIIGLPTCPDLVISSVYKDITINR
ncbi:Serine/threonine-protein phosphatase 7 long form-like protein, partial [Drosera capensis]